MKVIILAGGKGIRLEPLTKSIPKPMVQIGERPILWHIMKIYSFYNFNDFIICLGAKGHLIKDYFYNYDFYNQNFTINLSDNKITYLNNNSEDWRVTLVDTGLNTLKGGRIKRIEKFLDSKVNMLTYGDGLADINLNKLLDFHESHGKIVTITGVRAPSRFGKLIEKDGLVLSFKEKILSDLINGGFMVFNQELLDYLTPNENCDFEIGVLEELTKKREVMVYKHEGAWECMDNERDVCFLNNLWDKNQAFWKLWS